MKKIYMAPGSASVELFAENTLLAGSDRVTVTLVNDEDDKASGESSLTNKKGWSSENWTNGN